jgi:hypothetical protein
MDLVMLSRSYPLPTGAVARVDLLQDSSLVKRWEVTILVRTSRGVLVGSVTRRKTRTEAMRLVRKAIHG